MNDDPPFSARTDEWMGGLCNFNCTYSSTMN